MKNRFAKHLILLFCLAMIALSCVDEYTIPETTTTEYDAEVVIEGRILAGEESVIHLSYTTPINNEEEVPDILNAQVYVIGQNGFRSEAAKFDIEDDCYVIDTRTLENNTLYAVEVTVDDDTYQSEFQPLLSSPEIDDIIYKEHEDRISIHVSTHNDENGEHAYMWTYEEDWEFHSDIDITGVGGIVLYNKNFYQLEGKNPYLYCWGHQKSRNINIYNTETLGENKVMEHELLQIPIDDIRISYIYSILVRQWVLSDEAFDYFRLLKRYTEEMDGLFSPVPTEVKGNVSCISNPEIRVHGFVSASTITEKRIFIYESDFQKLESEYENCFWMDPTSEGEGWAAAWSDRIDMGVGVVHTTNGVMDLSSIYYQKECFDCREAEGATKKRPYFWPNNHE